MFLGEKFLTKIKEPNSVVIAGGKGVCSSGRGYCGWENGDGKKLKNQIKKWQ